MPDTFTDEDLGILFDEDVGLTPEAPQYTPEQEDQLLSGPALNAGISDQDLRNRLPGAPVFNATPPTQKQMPSILNPLGQTDQDAALSQEIWKGTIGGSINQVKGYATPEKMQDILNPIGAVREYFNPDQPNLPGTQAKIASGVVGGIAETAGGLVEDPDNIALLMTGALPEEAGVIASTYFMAQMLKGAPGLYHEVKDALESGDTQREAEALTKAIASIGFFGAMAGHVKGGVSKFLESTTPETRAKIYEKLKPKEEVAQKAPETAADLEKQIAELEDHPNVTGQEIVGLDLDRNPIYRPAAISDRLVQKLKDLKERRDKANASSQQKAAEVHGDVQSQSGEGVQQVSAKEGEPGVQSSKEGGGTPAQSESGKTSEVSLVEDPHSVIADESEHNLLNQFAERSREHGAEGITVFEGHTDAGGNVDEGLRGRSMAYNPATKRIRINRTELMRDLARFGDDTEAQFNRLDTIFKHEEGHGAVDKNVTPEQAGEFWRSLPKVVQNLFGKFYGEWPEGYSDNAKGAEYLRHVRDWALGEDPYKIFEAKGLKSITQRAINLTLRAIHEAQKRLPTKGGAQLRATLSQMEGKLKTASEIKAKGGDESFSAPEGKLQKKDDLRDRLNQLISADRKRILDEGQGQEILNTAEDEGRRPKDIADDFFKNVYPTLDGQAKVRMDKFLKANTGGTAPGDVIGTKPGPEGTRVQVVARDWMDIIPDVLEGNDVSQLQGTTRGLAAIMEFGNKKFKPPSVTEGPKRIGPGESFSAPKLEEALDDPKKMGEIRTFPKGELGGGPTGWAFELGSKVKTTAELDQFKKAYQKYSDQAAALKNKYDADKAATGKGNIADIMAMQEVGLKGQLAHEAYQAATGERLDGLKGTSTDFIRKHYKPDYSPPMAGENVPRGTESFSTPVPKTVRDAMDATKKVVKKLDNKRRAFGTLWKSKGTGGDMALDMDAADNMAVNAGEQVRKGLEIGAPKPDQNAASAIIASGFDRAELQAMKAKITSGVDGPKKAEAIRAIDKALTEYNRLEPLARRGVSDLESELQIEQARGIDVDHHEDYLPGVYDKDLWMGSRRPFVVGGGGSGISSGFKKGKTYNTPFDAIADGYAPKSIALSELAEHRVRSGQQLMNRRAWAEGLKQLTDPSDGKPVATNLIRKPRPGGGFDESAPLGYQTVNLPGGTRLAIHEVYAPVFKALTGESIISSDPRGKTILETQGALKHGLLAVDTFHLSRMLQKQLILTGEKTALKSIGKGQALLEYADKDLNRAVAAGELTQEMADWVRQNRGYADLALTNGLNVGRIAEAMYTSFVREMPGLRGTVGKFNQYVFEKITRSAMLESFIHEFDRVKRNRPELSDREAARRVSRDLNTYFGNLGRQGLFKSKSFQDAARLAFLAPQWFEAMARTEAKGFAQLAKGLTYDPVIHRTMSLGTLGKAMGQGLLAYFVGTQLLNLGTRHQFTWQNDEEGHKMDAWIPSIDGKGNGFFLSPLAIPAELTHDLIRYTKKDGNAMLAAAHVISNKASSLARAGAALGIGKSFWDDTKTDEVGGRIKKSVIALNPTPIPLQPAFKTTYPGQAQRQITGSLGIKTEPAETAVQQVLTKAKRFMQSEGTVVPQIVPSDAPNYSKLRAALRTENYKDANKIFNEMAKTRPEGKILDAMEHNILHPFTSSRKQEDRFRASLNDKELELYDKAVDQRRDEFQKFMDNVWSK